MDATTDRPVQQDHGDDLILDLELEAQFAEPSAPEPTRRFAHQPALDGLRGLAVAAVVLFHAGVPGFDGGYVGVSVFFTLSGFLITSLLLRERASTGRIDAGAFYARRARRLLPASVVCLLGITALATLGTFDQVADLRRDVWGAALQVFNWVRLAGSGSYADLFARTGAQPSPVEHYWSLAIEEQFYWVWPVAFAALAARARRRNRSVLRPIAGLALAGVVAAPIIAVVSGPDAAYWSTFARVGEILTGALAAVWVLERGVPRWARALVPWCLAVLALEVLLLPRVGGPAYHGWFPAMSVVTAVLLVGLQQAGGGRRALAWRPIVALGAISYGVYLYHWPIFVVVDEERLGRGGIVLLAVRLAFTLALAIASHRWLEQPVRRSRLPNRTTLLAGLAATVVVLVAALAIGPARPAYDDGRAVAAEARITGRPTRPLTGPAEAVDSWRRTTLPAAAPTRPVRILVVGDSTAKAVGGGLVRWAAAHPELAQVTVQGQAGCGFVRGGTRVFAQGEQQVSATCTTYATEVLPGQVRKLQPDVVVAMTTAWDVLDQRFPGTGVEAPTDADYDRRVRRDFGATTRGLLDAGAPRVVWIEEPPADPFWSKVRSPQESPARHEVLHRAMRGLAAAHPEVATADLDWWLRAMDWDQDREVRRDGVHLSPDAADELARRWLGPLLIDAALTR